MPVPSFIYFDKQDTSFLSSVNRAIELSRTNENRFHSLLHPNGIIDLVASQELRMASAVINLLDTLQTRNVTERLQALENLHNEVLVTARTKFRLNTARVLIEIMKEIIRAYGNEDQQLKLAHDFRMAATGKPTVVRKFLKKYYLLEMPEAWNQLIFDHHVHDANTKGRKSPTHLIMDAWVKGIRSLTVIYYNYVNPEAGNELIQAAEIMGIKIRIGILYNSVFRNKLVDFIWIPHGFTELENFLPILSEPAMRTLSHEGMAASKWKEKYMYKVLYKWNENVRHTIAKEFSIELTQITEETLNDFVGIGQCAVLHISELIHTMAQPSIMARAIALQKNLADCDKNQKIHIEHELHAINVLTPEYFLEILEDYEKDLEQEMITEILTCKEKGDVPSLLRLSPQELATHIFSTNNAGRFILNLATLTPEEVLNLLWDCEGHITHLEIFNVNDWANGNMEYIQEINELMLIINNSNTPKLKQIINSLIQNCHQDALKQNKENNTENNSDTSQEKLLAPLPHEHHTYKDQEHDFINTALSRDKVQTEFTSSLHNAEDKKDNTNIVENTANLIRNQYASSPKERIIKLRNILRHIITLTNYYRKAKLFTRMGTDSTSREGRLAGMGLAYAETLPKRAIKELKKGKNASRLRLPLRKEIRECFSYRMPFAGERLTWLTRIIRHIPFLKQITFAKKKYWTDDEHATHVFNNGMCSNDTSSFPTNQGNIITLGGGGKRTLNDLTQDQNKHSFLDFTYMNTNVLNVTKILIGFIPAFFSFQYTQDLPLLAWFGAIIWFLITGLRNIVQAVLGGGGFQRSPFLRWNNYVSWSRLSDSLMYTGLSVVLLELLVRNLFLQNFLHVTSVSSPLLAFSIISLINGCYIVFHNYIRGLQAEAMIGNFFRSFFAIPIALVYNMIFTSILMGLDVQSVDMILLSSSAIISKVASDTVAGIIEGFADKRSYIWFRNWDYDMAKKQLYDNYAKLELHFPEKDVLTMLQEPQVVLDELKKNSPLLFHSVILSALDLMYLYYYQPRALSTLKELMHTLSGMERLAWLRVQNVLKCQKDVSQLFVDGFINKNFSTALSFYLNTHEKYLNELQVLYLGQYAAKTNTKK